MAELSEEIKTEIVVRLARFERPADLVRLVQDEFEVECTIQQVIAYDASRPWFRASEKWRTIFDAAREEYLHQVAKIPIAQMGFRLNTLNKLLHAELGRGEKGVSAALTILEQAAKEAGGLYSNVRVNVGQTVPGGDLSEEERRAKFTSIIDGALTRALTPTAPAPTTTQ